MASKLDYTRGDYVGMERDLMAFDWPSLFSCRTVNESYELLVSTYSQLCAKFIPTRQPRLGNAQPQWFTQDIRRSNKELHKLWYRNNACKWRRQDLSAQYEQLRKQNKDKLTLAIKAFERNLASQAKSDPKRVYAYVRSRQRTCCPIRSLRDTNGDVCVLGADLARIFNNQFNSVFIEDRSTTIPALNQMCHTKIDHNAMLSLITPMTVRDRLASLDENKSPGQDMIHPMVLKRCSNVFALPISLVFRMSIRDGTVPEY